MQTIPLNQVKGIKDALYSKFKQNKIYSTYDLFLLEVKKYSNFVVTNIDALKHDDEATIIGKIQGPIKHYKTKIHITRFNLLVNESIISIVCFNRKHLAHILKEGINVIIKGKVNLIRMTIVANYISTNLNQPDIKPIYNIEGINDYVISKALKEIIDNSLVEIYESLPYELINKNKLLSRKEAHILKHFPKSQQDIEKAQYRFKYEEALNIQLLYQSIYFPKITRPSKNYDINTVKQYISNLKFELTDDQKKVVNQVFTDFKTDKSSYRLIQGDVGSGKTICAFIGAIGVITANEQVCFMAPTSILAKQQFDSFTQMFPNIEAVYISSKTKNIGEINKKIKSGFYKIIFGTHKLASDDIIYNNLGLVIIDEQQRFGVTLRERLLEKSDIKDVIYLTATPIPRTLSLAYLSNLDISTIKTKPTDHKPVDTKIIKNSLDDIISNLKVQINEGNQTFIVAPLINDDANSVEHIYQRLMKESFKEHIYVLHGKQSDIDNEYQLSEFTKDESGILIATTMVEVGINCLNATQIYIVASDYFGLSALHQLRGRVGRGVKPGYCFLMTDDLEHERLNILKNTYDGFTLSDMDLKLRGPGSIISTKQSGSFKLSYLDVLTDVAIIKIANKDATYMLDNKSKFSYIKKTLNKFIITDEVI